MRWLWLLWIAHPALADDLAYGTYLSGECAACHGQSSVAELSGWPAGKMQNVLEAYKSGARDNEIMQVIAARLGAREIAALAQYFEQQHVK